MDIFDCGGDSVASIKGIQGEVPQAQHAKGFIFTIDPFQLPNLRSKLQQRGVTLPPLQNAALPLDILQTLIEAFEEWGAASGGKIKTPVAFVVSKLDIWRDAIYPTSSLHRPSVAIRQISHLTAQLDHSALEDESDMVRAHLRVWDPMLCTLIEQTFERYSFFAVSALGKPPIDGMMTSPVEPDRVELPLLWLADETGVIAI